MKIPLADVILLYENIVKDINIAEVSMILFTALDIDALCTYKILSKFLKNENIEYKIYPVSTYTELEQKIEDCKAYEKVRLFFFINCGGIIDLTTKPLSKNAQIFLFDVNKPIHHANLEAPNIKVIDDKFSDFTKAPTSKEVEMYEDIDDYFLEQMEQKQQEQLSEDEDEIVARKRKRNKSTQQAIQKIQKIRKIKNDITMKIQSYYSQQFFGLPSSYLAYKMMKDLNKLNNSYIWYAIVGCTGMFLQQKLQKEQFQMISSVFKYDVLKFNQPGLTTYEKNSLKTIVDFQFPLMRHWSLYDSILNSGYMVAKLGLWNEKGLQKLHELLNLIGLSLQECQQLYKFMLKTSIQKLQKEIYTHVEKERFKLLDIAFDSFSKQIDYGFEMSATDFYYTIVTILEKPTKQTNIGQVLDHRIKCFWEAYNCFGYNQTKMKPAIEQAKKSLHIYITEAKSIIERNNIMYGTNFDFLNIHNDTDDRKTFEHPNSLTRLSYMLMQISKQKKKAKEQKKNKNREQKKQEYKPFVASLQNNQTKTTQIVGIMNETKNSFSSKLNLVIQQLNVEVRMDSFMNNIMTVPKDSMIKIIKELNQM